MKFWTTQVMTLAIRRGNSEEFAAEGLFFAFGAFFQKARFLVPEMFVFEDGKSHYQWHYPVHPNYQASNALNKTKYYSVSKKFAMKEKFPIEPGWKK